MFNGNLSGAGKPWFDVTFYGAKDDCTTNNDAAVQAAATAAAAVNGGIYFPDPQTAGGCYLLGKAGTYSGLAYSVLTSQPVSVKCESPTRTTIKLANASVTSADTQYMMFVSNSSVSHGLTLTGCTFDGNGANQTFTSFTSADYFGIYSAVNSAASVNDLYVATNDHFLNWTEGQGAGKGHGLPIDTYGFAQQVIEGNLFENDDYGIFVTQPLTTSPNHSVIDANLFHNIWNFALYNEGYSGVTATNGVVWNDALPASTDIAATGIGLLTQSAIYTNIYSHWSFQNLDYAVLVGLAGGHAVSSSVISQMSAYNLRAGYHIDNLDESSVISDLSCKSCSQGGITGTTVYGDFELNSGAPVGLMIAHNLTSIGAGSYAFSLLGKAQVLSGHIASPTGGYVAFSDQTNSIVRDVTGYNPVGTGVTTPALPTSSTFIQNTTGVDVEVYLTAGTYTAVYYSATTNGVGSVNLGAVNSMFLPAGYSIAVTYSAAPTWHWIGQ